MEGGGAGESFKLGDIGNYTDLGDLYPIASASLVGINFGVLFARMGGIGGLSLNTYFDTFGLEGVLANVSLLTIVFQIARWAYTTFYTSGGRPWSPFVFVCILILVQLLHDLIFYFGALQSFPSGKNDMIDVLKRYAAENGSRAMGGHAAFLIFVAVIAMFLKETTFMFSTLVLIVAFYALPFLITTLGPRVVQQAPKEEKKAAQQPVPQRPINPWSAY
jgi:hypothetical protein